MKGATKMEVIKTYLDNVFAAYPQTDEIKRVKRDLSANMEEKYTALRQNGKSEHEAAYSVIANFGNIEEITSELGLVQGLSSGLDGAEIGKSIFLSADEARIYLAKCKSSGVMIGLGVWLIIAGVSTVILFEQVFVMFLAIAVAVGIFIINGSRLSEYEAFEETAIRLDTETYGRIADEYAKNKMFSTVLVAFGVVLIILTAGAFTAVEVPIPLFLNVIGFSVFLFVIAASYNPAYEILLGKGDYVNKTANNVIGRIIGTIAAVYWPIATVIYLTWSFAAGAWAISWVIWPVAGILFGAISGGISVWYSEKES
jgi:hypothetical protein